MSNSLVIPVGFKGDTKGLAASARDAEGLIERFANRVERRGSLLKALNPLGDLKKGFAKATDNTVGKLGVGIAATFKDIASSSFSFASSVASAFNPLNLIGGFAAVPALVGAGLIGTGVAAVKLAADLEQTTVAFEVMLGSADRAKSLLGDIRDFAAATPFESGELIQSARQLSAFGSEANDIVPTLRVLGDIASGTGMKIEELTFLYGQFQVQGRLYQSDINQLTARGIPVYQELGKVFGVNERSLRGMIEAGQVGFRDIQMVLNNLTGSGGRFSGMMERQSKTLYGLFSTLKDNATILLTGFGEVAVQELGLHKIVEGISNIVASGKDLPERLRPVFRDVRAIMVDVFDVGISFVSVLIEGVKEFGIELKSVLSGIKEIVASVKSGGLIGRTSSGAFTVLGRLVAPGLRLNQAQNPLSAASEASANGTSGPKGNGGFIGPPAPSFLDRAAAARDGMLSTIAGETPGFFQSFMNWKPGGLRIGADPNPAATLLRFLSPTANPMTKSTLDAIQPFLQAAQSRSVAGLERGSTELANLRAEREIQTVNVQQLIRQGIEEANATAKRNEEIAKLALEELRKVNRERALQIGGQIATARILP